MWGLLVKLLFLISTIQCQSTDLTTSADVVTTTTSADVVTTTATTAGVVTTTTTSADVVTTPATTAGVVTTTTSADVVTTPATTASVVTTPSTTTAVTTTTIAPLTYDQQITNKLADIDATKAKVTLDYNGELPAIQNVQSVIVSLGTALPKAIINERLDTAFSIIEAISNAMRGTNEAICFQNLATTKTSAAQQAQLTFSSCTATITTATNQLTSTINTNIATFNSVTNTARANVAACGTNSLYRLSDVLFNYCLTAATTAYDMQLSALRIAIATLQAKRRTNVNDVAICVGRAVARAESLMENFNQYIRLCISNSPIASDVTSLITTVQLTSESYYATQVTGTTNTYANLTEAKSEAQNSLNGASVAVAAATAARAQTFTSTKTALETEFATVAQRFTAAATAFAKNSLATTCVNNIRSALQNNIYKQATQIATCIQGLRTSSLVSDLSQIQTLYNQRQSKEGLTAIQCLGQVDNLFIDQGITKCREDGEADDTANLIYLSYKEMTLKEEAELVSKAASQCNIMGRTYVTRQINKDKLSFETCILRTIRQVYVI